MYIIYIHLYVDRFTFFFFFPLLIDWELKDLSTSSRTVMK